MSIYRQGPSPAGSCPRCRETLQDVLTAKGVRRCAQCGGVFADNEQRKIRVLFQQPDGSFKEMDEKLEPSIASLGQWICLADLDGDGRLDIVLSRTVSSSAPNEKGGIDVYLNKAK